MPPAVEEWLPTSLPGYGEIVGHIDRLRHRTGAAIVKVTGDVSAREGRWRVCRAYEAR